MIDSTPRMRPIGRRAPVSSRWRREQLLDRAVEPHVPVAEQHDAVADALDVAQHAGRDDDRRAGLGRALHQQAQELAAREGIEARERLVEQDQRRALAERQREREPRPLARREHGDARLGRRAREQFGGERLIPARVRRAREVEHLADAEAAVERRALGDVADVRERVGVAARIAAEIETVPSLGSSRPTARPSSVDLPAPFGPAMPTIDCSGIVRLQSRSRPRAPISLAERRGGEQGIHATRRSSASRSVVETSARMLSASMPARCASTSHSCSARRSASWCSSDEAMSVLETNVPRPCVRLHETLVLELAVGLRDGVRVDRELGDDLAHRRQLVADIEQAQPQSLLHLLHDLQVHRQAGVLIQVELHRRESTVGPLGVHVPLPSRTVGPTGSSDS